MSRMLRVASTEYTSTVTTKGFLIGILLTPLLMVVAIAAIPLLINKSAPKVTGEVAIIDQSGQAAKNLEAAFAPEEVQKRRERTAQKRSSMFDKASANMPLTDEQKKLARANMESVLVESNLTFKVLPPDADVDKEKAPITGVDAKGSRDPNQRLALVVIPKETVSGKAPAGEDGAASADATKPPIYPNYQMFMANRLDPEVQGEIMDPIDKAIVDTRLERAGMDARNLRAMMTPPVTDRKTVTAEGERKGDTELAAFLVPMAFMMLIWISTFSCGQYLLTSLIEEKSNRVMELLLSAVSPEELMWGKIAGQMAVALTIMLFYATLGGGALVAYGMMHLIDPINLVYLLVFFFMAFIMIASMMAAIGSAVSDIREAQSLLTPAMMILIIPMVVWMPLQRNPNSVFAQVISFVPPINPFVMILRLTGSEKVPFWQIPASIIVGAIGCFVFLKAAAKIFRVGVLMYGKPPSLLGLIKWIRYA